MATFERTSERTQIRLADICVNSLIKTMFDELSLLKALPVPILHWLNYSRHPCVSSLCLPPHSSSQSEKLKNCKKKRGTSAFHTLLKHGVQFEINQNTISLQHDKEVPPVEPGKSICGTVFLNATFKSCSQKPAFHLHLRRRLNLFLLN